MQYRLTGIFIAQNLNEDSCSVSWKWQPILHVCEDTNLGPTYGIYTSYEIA
jgi:hypothetical protein